MSLRWFGSGNRGTGRKQVNDKESLRGRKRRKEINEDLKEGRQNREK
jgi:hypothetical protein